MITKNMKQKLLRSWAENALQEQLPVTKEAELQEVEVLVKYKSSKDLNLTYSKVFRV